MIILALSLMMPGGTYADNPDCPQGSACAFTKEALRGYKKADADLEKAQAGLLAAIHDQKLADRLNLEVETVSAIEDVLKAWRPAMESECAVFGAVTGGASPWKSAWKVECEAGMMTDRATLLRSVISCLGKPWPTPWTEEEPMACLYPLTPSIPAKDYEVSG
jgi:uncharacterized protein YecT (DUF1311 family)